METFLEGTNVFKEVTIGEIIQISPDTRLYKFLLPSASSQLGILIGEAIILRGTIYSEKYPDGKSVKRKYSPTSRHDQLGFFEIPIKIYYPDDTYPGGQLTMFIDKLKVGDKIFVSGPRGKYIYNGNGLCENRKEKSLKTYRSLGFIAGGTGITPCFQYIQYIIERNEDVDLYLLFANKTEEDILLRNRLDEFASSGKLRVHYTVSKASEGWEYSVGYINQEMISQHMPKVSENCCIFFCGPKPMNRMLREVLPALGYENFIKY